jgi:hypothetical protein
VSSSRASGYLRIVQRDCRFLIRSKDPDWM